MLFDPKILDKNLNWYMSTLLIIPLIALTYYITYINMGEDKATGITGILILFSYSQFFFQRRKLSYMGRTILRFYLFGIVSTLVLSYAYFYTKYDWLAWLVLVQIYLYIQVLGRTSFLTDEGMEDLKQIVSENTNKKWYHGLIGTKTQLRESKYFILDIIVFIVFIVIVLFIKDKLF